MGKPLDSGEQCGDGYPASRGMVLRLSARSHRYVLRGEPREFRMEEWADADGVIWLLAYTVSEPISAPEKKTRGVSRTLRYLESIVRGKSL